MKLIINAPNVHQGGGKTLLIALLKGLSHDHDTECELIMDERMRAPEELLKNKKVRRVKPTIFRRLQNEWRLKKEVNKDDVVHCFGNLPPLFNLDCRTSVLVQNRYMVEDLSLSKFPLKVRLRIIIEKIWFKLCSSHVNEFIVQIPSMKRLLEARLKKSISVNVMPYTETAHEFDVLEIKNRKCLYDFLYVASGEPHKNHKRLIESWCLLANEGCFPSLCFTLSEKKEPGLCFWIEEKKKKYNLNIINVGFVSYDEIQKLYGNVKALIYPTIFESLGLALIEAKRVGLPIVASELDFVRDILDADETFDPYSPLSIARAVKRFMKIPEKKTLLFDVKDYVNYIKRGDADLCES